MQASDAIQPTDGDDFGHRIRSNILEISIRIRSEDFFFDPLTSVALSPSNQDFNSPTSVALGNLSQDNSPTSVTLGVPGLRISTHRHTGDFGSRDLVVHLQTVLLEKNYVLITLLKK